MFWVTIVMRLLFWGAVGLVVSLVVQRGVGRSVEDLRAWAEGVGRVWWREYARVSFVPGRIRGGMLLWGNFC